MKQLLMRIVYMDLMIATLNGPFIGTPHAEDATQQLTQIERRLAKAIVDKDLKTYDAILAPDWTTIDLTGHPLSKAQVLQEFASNDRQVEEAVIDDIRVTDLGNVAVVTGRTTAEGAFKGQHVKIVLRFTDVFVKRGHGWQVVASQGTRVVE